METKNWDFTDRQKETLKNTMNVVVELEQPKNEINNNNNFWYNIEKGIEKRKQEEYYKKKKFYSTDIGKATLLRLEICIWCRCMGLDPYINVFSNIKKYINYNGDLNKYFKYRELIIESDTNSKEQVNYYKKILKEIINNEKIVA